MWGKWHIKFVHKMEKKKKKNQCAIESKKFSVNLYFNAKILVWRKMYRRQRKKWEREKDREREVDKTM